MKSIKGLRWWIVGLLFVATLINYVDRQTLSILAPTLRDEFGMSATDYSRVVFVFLLGYMFMQCISGKLIDIIGVYRGFAITVVIWSIAAAGHALATGALSLGALRFVLGLGEAGNWPASIKVVATWFPPRERATATGLFNSGSIIGAMISAPLIAWMALTVGWRWAFVLTGATGFIWMALWLIFYRSPKTHPRLSPEELTHIQTVNGANEGKANEPVPTWFQLLRLRKVWGLIIARIFSDPVWWFWVFWLPEYLKNARGFGMEAIGRYAWIPFLTAGVGSLVGGMASSRMVRRGAVPVRARKFVMLWAAIGMLSGIPAVLTSSAQLAIAFLSVATFCYCVWASNILTIPADLFPDSLVGSVAGIAGTGAAFGGMIFTLATGLLVDHFSYTPVFFIAGAMPLVSITVLYTMVRGGEAGRSAA